MKIIFTWTKKDFETLSRIFPHHKCSKEYEWEVPDRVALSIEDVFLDDLTKHELECSMTSQKVCDEVWLKQIKNAEKSFSKESIEEMQEFIKARFYNQAWNECIDSLIKEDMKETLLKQESKNV